MPKIPENLDFSKQADQEKFERLKDKRRKEIVENASDEANSMNEMIQKRSEAVRRKKKILEKVFIPVVEIDPRISEFSASVEERDEKSGNIMQKNILEEDTLIYSHFYDGKTEADFRKGPVYFITATEGYMEGSTVRRKLKFIGENGKEIKGIIHAFPDRESGLLPAVAALSGSLELDVNKIKATKAENLRSFYIYALDWQHVNSFVMEGKQDRGSFFGSAPTRTDELPILHIFNESKHFNGVEWREVRNFDGSYKEIEIEDGHYTTEYEPCHRIDWQVIISPEPIKEVASVEFKPLANKYIDKKMEGIVDGLNGLEIDERIIFLGLLKNLNLFSIKRNSDIGLLKNYNEQQKKIIFDPKDGTKISLLPNFSNHDGIVEGLKPPAPQNLFAFLLENKEEIKRLLDALEIHAQIFSEMEQIKMALEKLADKKERRSLEQKLKGLEKADRALGKMKHKQIFNNFFLLCTVFNEKFQEIFKKEDPEWNRIMGES